MSESGRVIAFEAAARPASFAAVHRHLTRLLLRHALIDSFHNFRDAGRPYPFVRPQHLLPGPVSRGSERSHQNTALIFAVDGRLPVALNKHFRLRAANRVTWRNLQRLAPELDLSDYKASDNRFGADDFDILLRKLLPLDYALLVQQDADRNFHLSHLHVKVERLTDNAIKELGRRLGYIERRLFERGEDYVDALESKFFEYHGFSANASGRKSAAAMAAQLFADTELEHVVYIASQEDNRLTVLGQHPSIVQYLLVRLDGDAWRQFQAALAAAGQDDPTPYVVARDGGAPVAILRAAFRRTPPALGSSRDRRDKDVLEPWLELISEQAVAAPGAAAPELDFAWSRSETAPD